MDLTGGLFSSSSLSPSSRIPVFVFPSAVFFNAKDRSHHNLKQILTIYNPYEFPIRFKVLSNSPSTYTVVDPEGSIQSKNCVDLIIRVSDPPPEPTTSSSSSSDHYQQHHSSSSSSNNSYVEHKFRVQIYSFKDRHQLLGTRDVMSVIHWGQLPPHLASAASGEGTGGGGDMAGGPSTSGGGSFQNMASSSSSSSSSVGAKRDRSGSSSAVGVLIPAGQQPNYVIIVTALICIIGLMLPLDHDDICKVVKDESSGSSPATASTSTIMGENRGGDDASSVPSSFSSILSLIPSYLELSVNQKLLAAYALGLVTMVVFRP